MASGLSDLVLDTQIRVEFHQTAHHRFVFEPATLTTRPTKYVRRRETQHVWVKERLLGHGSYGDVYLHRCTSADDDETALQAVKKIDKARMVVNKINYHKEIEAIAKFSQEKYHGLFVKFLGWYENEFSVFIAMEYIEHGDLSSHLTQPLPEVEARIITFQLAEGLMFLHANSFVHRDVKPKNIFVIQTGPEWHVKLGDFGISKRISDTTNISSFVETRLFMAPEIQGFLPPEEQDESIAYNFTQSIDMWSLGVTTFFLLFHDYPFSLKQANKLPRYVSGGEFPFPERSSSLLSQECYQFMEGVMGRNPRNRLSAKEALEGKWLCPLYADALEETTNLDKCEPKRISGKTLLETTPDIQNGPITTETLKPNLAIQPNSPNPDLNDTQESDPNKTVTLARSKKDIRRDPETVRIASSPSSKLEKSRRHVSFASSVTSIDRLEHLYRDEPTGEINAERKNNSEGQKNVVIESSSQMPVSADEKNNMQRKINMLSDSHCKGVMLLDNDKYDQAEKILKQVLDERKSILGSEHESTLTTCQALGSVCYKKSNFDKAYTMFRMSADGRKKVLGKRHPETLRTQYWLGDTELQRRIYAKAESILRETAYVQRNVLGPNDPMTLETLQRVGLAFANQRKWAEAQAVFHHVTWGKRKVLGRTHISTQKSLAWFGYSAFNLGWYENAVEPLQEVVADRKARFGRLNPTTIDSVTLLGECLHKLKRYDEARLTWEEAISMCKNDDCEGLKIYAKQKLGESLACYGDQMGAITAFREAAEGRTKHFGPRHRSTLESTHSFGCMIANIGIFSAAEAYLETNKKIAIESLGFDDPLTISIMTSLVIVQDFMKTGPQFGHHLQLSVPRDTELSDQKGPPNVESLHSYFSVEYELNNLDGANLTCRQTWDQEVTDYGRPSLRTLKNLTLLVEASLESSEFEVSISRAELLVKERIRQNGEMDESTQKAKKLLADTIHRIRDQDQQKEAQKKQRKILSRVSSLWDSKALKGKTKATTQG